MGKLTIGRIISIHGKKNKYKILGYYENMMDFLQGNIFLKDKKLVPKKITYFNIKKNHYLIQGDWLMDSNIINQEITMEMDDLPPLPMNTYYTFNLLYKEVTYGGKSIGVINNVINMNNNILLTLKTIHGEFNIPFHDVFIYFHREKNIFYLSQEGLKLLSIL